MLVKVGIAREYGGVGVQFSLNGVNILESRAATGGGWQTSSVIWDGPSADNLQYILFNQGAGNSRGGQWGYSNTYSGLKAQDFNRIWSDKVHPASDHNINNTTSPCPFTDEVGVTSPNGYMFDYGKLNIGMATGSTPSHGNLVLLTNAYTYQHQGAQAWARWYAEQAFYLDKKVARSNNLRVYLTHSDDTKEQISPFANNGTQGRGIFGNEYQSLKYAVLVWNINGKDIGVAIDGRPPETLLRPNPPKFFHGSFKRQDGTFGCNNVSDDNCGVFEWHTYMEDRQPATFSAGEQTKVSTDYRVGTLEQLADWGYTIGTAPVCASVTLTPINLPSSGGTVSAQANCTGGGATYTWTVNGTTYPGSTASISTTVGANASGSAQSYLVCASTSNASGNSQPACATLTQAAQVPSGPVALVMAESNNVLWPASGLIDGNVYSTYSSNVFPSSTNNSGTYVAGWAAGPNVVQTIRLYARNSNGQMLGFPASYNIYLTSADNSQWVSIGTFSQQPNGSGVAAINLPGPTTTWGILIVPVSIGTDNVGNYVFQLNEIELVR